MIPYPNSISAGGQIAATALTRQGFAVVTIDPRSQAVHTVVARTTQSEGSLEPAISPDGKEIVYKVDRQTGPVDEGGLVSTDLMIVPSTGGTPRRLARIPGGAAWPSWDPSGSRLAFTALGSRKLKGAGPKVDNAVMEINADGTCLTSVYAVENGAVFGAAWQPGAERGAGPLSC